MSAFSPRVILTLVLVGVFSFCALVVLFAYAPDLRNPSDGGAHALSKSAVGFAGVVALLKADGVPVLVSRNAPQGEPRAQSLLVVTPTMRTNPEEMLFSSGGRTILIVLPKWSVGRHPLQSDWVTKGSAIGGEATPTRLLQRYAKTTRLELGKGAAAATLSAAGPPFAPGARFTTGRIDRLQTLAGEGWRPVLVDASGRAVLAASITKPSVYVLADPDLLNTQGVADLKTATAGVAILEALGAREAGVSFNVFLNGFKRERSLLRLVLEPPLLAATLCALAAALLMGVHALARFGPTLVRGRAIALGKRALVDNAAGLVRMAGREGELAPAYAALTAEQIAKAAGGDRVGAHQDREAWLDRMARLKGVVASRAELTAEADKIANRADLLGLARKLYDWKAEMTRERR